MQSGQSGAVEALIEPVRDELRVCDDDEIVKLARKSWEMKVKNEKKRKTRNTCGRNGQDQAGTVVSSSDIHPAPIVKIFHCP